MSSPFGQRPRVRKVTVEIEGYDGQVARFIYHDTFPDQEPDESTGIELELEMVSSRDEDHHDPTRILGPMRHVHTMRVENSPTYTVEIVTPPTRASSERATPDELPAAPLALDAAGG